MLPSNDHRNVRWAHAFCAQNNAPLVFSSGKSPVLPEMTAVDVRAVTRDLKKFKCGICGRKGVRACWLFVVVSVFGWSCVVVVATQADPPPFPST